MAFCCGFLLAFSWHVLANTLRNLLTCACYFYRLVSTSAAMARGYGKSERCGVRFFERRNNETRAFQFRVLHLHLFRSGNPLTCWSSPGWLTLVSERDLLSCKFSLLKLMIFHVFPGWEGGAESMLAVTEDAL